jgi:HlyD family secretion protein
MQFSKNRLIAGIILILLIIIVSLFLVGNKSNSTQTNVPGFKEVKVERGTFEIIVSANGTVKPIDRIEIKSKASGEVVELPVEEGDFIHKGDLIAKLDQKDERANFEQAQADLDIANAQLTQAQRTYDRREQLFKSNLISEEERDQIVLNLAVAKGKVVQAKTALERARERLSEAVVRAPIDGIILQKYVEQGQIIASGINNVGGGTPIVDIADMASVYIEAGIDEVDIGKIQVGQTAMVVADAYPDLKFHGKIVRIDPEATVEQNVTLFDVIIEVENTDGKLKSGMNTNIEITIQKQDDVLLAPTVALQTSQRGNWQGSHGQDPNERMVLLKEGDKYVPHKVTVGASNFKQVIITAGLDEGNILGVPMVSRLKEENDQLEQRIKSSRSFGTSNQSSSKQ